MRALAFVCAIVLALAVAPPAPAQCANGRCGVASYPAPTYQVAPVAYQLADSTGQVYRHPDPTYLTSWIAARNAELKAPVANAKPVAKPREIGAQFMVGDEVLYFGTRVKLIALQSVATWTVQRIGTDSTFTTSVYYLTPIAPFAGKTASCDGCRCECSGCTCKCDRKPDPTGRPPAKS